MRRPALLPVLATTVVLALTVAGCTSGSTTKRTVTVVNTITSSAAPASKPLSSVVVVSPAATPTPTTTKTAPKPTPTAPPAAAIVKVDPLKADCVVLLDPTDVKKAIGATIGTGANRIRLNATGRGATGAIRCLYGSKDKGKTAPVRIRLTQYSSAAAAQAQFKIDVQTATDAGATVTDVKVNGYPAKLILQAGGIVEMVYGTWTMSVAVSDKLATNAELTKGLPVLAGQALTRIIKNG